MTGPSLVSHQVRPGAIYIALLFPSELSFGLVRMTAIPAIDDTSNGKQHIYDAGKKPPPFGHALRAYWAFDPGFVNLNIG